VVHHHILFFTVQRSENLRDRDKGALNIVHRLCATIIIDFLFSLALISAPAPAAASISPPQNEERININTASVEDLQRLPGIGPALASRIVEHRRKHGLFKRPQDIVIVRGMSAKFYRRIAHLIRV
jgi:competence ComEA-like helix-hairpin-helix protein